jgi:hypothetical protein
MDYRRGADVMPTTIISATPSVFVPQELVESANAQAQLDALSSAIPLFQPPSLVSSGSVEPADAHVQAAMSKTQYQLTVEEGKLWEKLTDPGKVVDDYEHEVSTTASLLAFLREKSSFMVQSYLRRNNPPTEFTYDESKNILHAMGVPCIESTGPYEAEALASSLVINGCADYVASEDTVRVAFHSFISSRPQVPNLFIPHFARLTNIALTGRPLYVGRARLRSATPP